VTEELGFGARARVFFARAREILLVAGVFGDVGVEIRAQSRC
jgi:hypothetical protein